MRVDFVLVICAVKEFSGLVPPFNALRVPALSVQINVANACLLATPVTVALICRVRVIADVFRETIAKLRGRSEEHTSELQSRLHLVCRLLLEKKNKRIQHTLEH